jgi:hypothetical protein
MSGLTIGLVGLDLTTVEILARSGSAKEVRNSENIFPIPQMLKSKSALVP